jgi:hypothetical protein
VNPSNEPTFWRWLVVGLGGLLGMMEQHSLHGPPAGSRWLGLLKELHAKLGTIIEREQKK